MAKSKVKYDEANDDLLEALGIEVESEGDSGPSARDERVVAGFEDIVRFVETNHREPKNTADADIFERMYAVRLEKIRSDNDLRALAAQHDKLGLVSSVNLVASPTIQYDNKTDELLSSLEITVEPASDITTLKHVVPRAERTPPDEIAQHTPCRDFEKFRPLFQKVKTELKSGERKAREFKDDISIKQGQFFILGGQLTYVASMGEEIRAPSGETDARLRVVYDNKTESNILRRSLIRALYKNDRGVRGQRITDTSFGPLFSDTREVGDVESGTVYVLRSKSTHPFISHHRDVVHKIGMTGDTVENRIANATRETAFLMAEVEIVQRYELSNINRQKLEALLHSFFDAARLRVTIEDANGQPFEPREWFVVPVFVIDEAIEKLKDGTLAQHQYDLSLQRIIKSA